MSEADRISVGTPLPRVLSARAFGGTVIEIEWDAAVPPVIDGRAIERARVDLAPVIFTYAAFKPLRGNPEMFATVRPIHEGHAVGWGAATEDDEAQIDLAATTLERLLADTMDADQFRAFMDRHRFTRDACAAQLGISRRQVGYYLIGRDIPRLVALACRFLDQRKAHSTPAPSTFATAGQSIVIADVIAPTAAMILSSVPTTRDVSSLLPVGATTSTSITYPRAIQ
jgi:hypothetical protein